MSRVTLVCGPRCQAIHMSWVTNPGEEAESGKGVDGLELSLSS
jgi:hypothetical protein